MMRHLDQTPVIKNKQLPDWTDPAVYYEYTAAVSPHIPAVPAKKYPSALHKQGETRVIPFDLSDDLAIDGLATTPNLNAAYLKICAGESLTTEANASAQLFYVIRGRGETRTDFGTLPWAEGDVFTIPATSAMTHMAQADSALYWVNDAPLLEYLGAQPTQARFKPTLYPQARIQEENAKVDAQPGARDRNRNAIILGNVDQPQNMSLSHILWSTIVYVAPGEVQRAHRHNSVAVDIVMSAGENTYTLVGKAVDTNGDIINPQRIEWESGAAFVTPPGLWHSHHNESGEPAVIMAVQEAGLYIHMRTLDIQFTPPPKRS